MSQRKEFIDACLDDEEGSMTERCARFGISRKTGYKWLNRFLVGCELKDRSSRPLTSPNIVPPKLEEQIVQARKDRPRWGPKKLHTVVQRANPQIQLPSVSTFALIFKRHGLVAPRRRRYRTPPSTTPLAHATGPNSVWCIDFKGDFALGPTRRCYPLTISDAYSRYLIACIALPSTNTTLVFRALKRVFAEFGLPDAIRSDNGVPFASASTPFGMSELSAWWMKLAIRHERIEPGKPQQNGRHERMHLTLKQATAMPPETSMRAQQRSFDRFRVEYNDVRPHEALCNNVPADFYARSSRPLPDPYWGADFEYEYLTYEPVRTTESGSLAWMGTSVFVSQAFKRELLGATWCGPHWDLYFGPLRLGALKRQRGGKIKFVREKT